MRNRYILIVSFLCVQAVCQAEMTITDQTHWIRVSNHGELLHEAFSSSPVSYSYANEMLSAGASTSISSFDDFDRYSTDVSAIADMVLWDEGGAVYNFDIRTAISTTFQPRGNSFEIHALLHDEWWGCRSYVELTDNTAGECVYYADYFGGEYDYIGALNIDHTYSLYVYSGVSLLNQGVLNPDWYLLSCGNTYFKVFGETPNAIVPESASVLLLAFGGLALRLRER